MSERAAKYAATAAARNLARLEAEGASPQQLEAATWNLRSARERLTLARLGH